MSSKKRREITLTEARRIVDACSKLSCSHLIDLKDDLIPGKLTIFHSPLLDIDPFMDNAQ